MESKQQRVLKLMNQIDETRATMVKGEAYEGVLREMLMRVDEFNSMSDKAREEILTGLGNLMKYFVNK